MSGRRRQARVRDSSFASAKMFRAAEKKPGCVAAAEADAIQRTAVRREIIWGLSSSADSNVKLSNHEGHEGLLNKTETFRIKTFVILRALCGYCFCG